MISRLAPYLPVSISDSFLQRKAQDINFLRKMVLNSSPKGLVKISHKKVIKAFQRAATKIPQYEKLLKTKRVNPKSIKNVDDFQSNVPIIDKKSYVKKSKTISNLCVDSSLSSSCLVARSSGYSGKSSTWAKSREEQQESKNFAALGLDLLYSVTSEHTLLIDAFALGSWVSGVDLLMIGDSKCSVIAPGADIEETISIVKDLQKEFDQFIIAGTPHFLKILVEQLASKINTKKVKINLLVGGQGFNEEWREYVNNLLGNTVKEDKRGFTFSAYGASDLGVTGVNETQQSAQIRNLCRKRKSLAKKIFRKYSPVLPMLFQYDPTKYFIETVENDELVFTNCDLKALMPLIRYNIHDVGGLISHEEMQQILDEEGVKIDIKVPLPFVFVVGRSDGTINFIGSPVYPGYVSDALSVDKSLYSKVSGYFKLQQVHDSGHNPFLQVEIQLKKGVKKTASLEKRYHHKIERFFKNLDADFKQNLNLIEIKAKKSPVIVKLYEYEKYPYKQTIKVKYT